MKEPSYKYSVKIISPTCKSEYTVKRLATTVRFTSLNQVTKVIHTSLSISFSQLGFIDPGHGLKGKQIRLSTDGDLDRMYDCVSSTKEIMLWCLELPTNSNTKPRSVDKSKDTAKKSVIAFKICEVEEMVKKLSDKHGSKYSVEQLNAWAHLINVKKHDSYEHPPDLPYFRGFKKSKVDEGADSCTSVLTPTPKSSTVTATERVSLRSECINQLDKWYALLQKGAISQSHYEEIQSLIMKDIHSS